MRRRKETGLESCWRRAEPVEFSRVGPRASWPKTEALDSTGTKGL